MLAINEEFYSIQGEGLHTGIPMYFVRTQGCDVGCYFCDTKYTWRDKNPETDENDIVNRVLASRAEWVCITGGEPYEQNLELLVTLLHENDIKVHVETSGEVWSQYNIDWICLSPKDLFTRRDKRCDENFKHHANEIKCVVTKQEDVDYYIKWYYPFCTTYNIPLIFQPVDNDAKLIDGILKTINYRKLFYARVMIQMHKVIGVR